MIDRSTVIQEIVQAYWKEYADVVGEQYVSNIINAIESGYSIDEMFDTKEGGDNFLILEPLEGIATAVLLFKTCLDIYEYFRQRGEKLSDSDLKKELEKKNLKQSEAINKRKDEAIVAFINMMEDSTKS